MSATVRDGKGRLVRDLTKKDFEVLDRGEKRSITEFRSERAPLSLAIHASLEEVQTSTRVRVTGLARRADSSVVPTVRTTNGTLWSRSASTVSS